jgi:hypothetical protein
MSRVALGLSLVVIIGFAAKWLLSAPSDVMMPATQADASAPALPDASAAPAAAVVAPAPAAAAAPEPAVEDILAQAASAAATAPTPAPAAATAPATAAVPGKASDSQVSVDAILETAPALGDKAPVPETASYRLAIKPWGTVYVDGKEKGVSPPLKKLVLPAGKHAIRIANPGFPDFNMDVNLGKGKSSTIDYDFTARSK